MAAAAMTAPNFTLHDQNGQAVTLATLRGKFVLLTFLYVHCTNVCPAIAEQLNEALRELPSTSRAQVRVLAVSVDPKGDTPAAVANFIAVHRLLPQFLYLTGTLKTLLPVWNDYHIASEQEPGGIVLGHTALVILLGRNLRPVVVYDSSVTPEQVLHDLHVLGLTE
jgi:protein SCO1/2